MIYQQQIKLKSSSTKHNKKHNTTYRNPLITCFKALVSNSSTFSRNDNPSTRSKEHKLLYSEVLLNSLQSAAGSLESSAALLTREMLEIEIPPDEAERRSDLRRKKEVIVVITGLIRCTFKARNLEIYKKHKRKTVMYVIQCMCYVLYSDVCYSTCRSLGPISSGRSPPGS